MRAPGLGGARRALCAIVIAAAAWAPRAAAAEPANVALGMAYCSSFPTYAQGRYPDTGFKELTDGKKGSESPSDAAWQGRNALAGKPYWLTADLVYESALERLSIGFLGLPASGIEFPDSVRFSASADGLVYEYLGDASPGPEAAHRRAYELALPAPREARFVRAVVYHAKAAKSLTDELEVMGSRPYPAPIPFPASASVVLGEGYASQVLDLGQERELSVVEARGLDSWYGTLVEYDTAASRGKYLKLGMASTFTNSKKGQTWRLSLPYTVKARDLRITYIGSESANHAASVYGQAFAIARPAPAAPSAAKTAVAGAGTAAPWPRPDYSNVALGKAYTSSLAPVAGFPDSGGELSDGAFGAVEGEGDLDPRWVGYRLEGGPCVQVLDLGSAMPDIVGVGLEFGRKEEIGAGFPSSIRVSRSRDGLAYEGLGEAVPLVEVSGKRFFRLDFPGAEARYLRFEILGAGLVLEGEIQAYRGASPRPILNGGFIQIPIASADPIAKFDESQWRREMDFVKGLGMDYVIVQYGADSKYKASLYPDPSLPGYAQSAGVGEGYGCPDPIEAIMGRCDELGIKVILGGVVDYGTWFSVQVDEAWIRGQVKAGIKVIDDLDARYARHPSFYGYYLADETCDEWLSAGKWKLSRLLYEGQSRHIRKIRPEAKILISPAAWRSTEPEVFADDLYKCVENGGDRPLVDIIAVQDCLGRPNAMFRDFFQEYEERERAISRMCRERIAYPGGIEFWNDAEIFDSDEEWTMWSKGIEGLRKMLALNSKYTNVTVCFDLSHYILPQAPDAPLCGSDQLFCDYSEYLAGLGKPR